MVNIIRTTAVWTGAPGLPGYSQFYQEAAGATTALAQAGHDDVREFFWELESMLPEEVTVTVNPLYQVLDSASGALVGEGTVGTPAAVVDGSFVGGWSARFGMLVEWVTAAIVDSRHLRGRTYLVPLGNLEDVDGTVPAATLAQLAVAVGAIDESANHFVVWHRPRAGAGGQVSAITGHVVRDHPTVLRSRMI